MEGFELLVAVVSVLAAVLLFISILAYKRERSWRLLFASIVFVLFLVKGIIMSISIFTSTMKDLEKDWAFHLLFDVIILLFLFITVLSPPKERKKVDLDSKITGEGKT